MPNWCESKIEITGRDTGKFYNFIKKSQEDNPAKDRTGFGATWLGNLLLSAGKDFEKICDREYPVVCRGSYGNVDFTDGVLTLYAESAWSPCYDLFRYIAQTMCFDVDVDFYAEEPGCEIYVASGENMTNGGNCVVDGYVNTSSPFYDLIGFWDYEKLVSKLKEKLETTEETDLTKLSSMVNEAVNDNDEFISIHLIKFEMRAKTRR